MTIVVGANSYVVGMSNKSAACIQHHVAYIFKRHAGESDALMQERVIVTSIRSTNEAACQRQLLDLHPHLIPIQLPYGVSK